MSEARIWYTKIGTITTAIDDFIDFGGSQEEVQNLARLVDRYVPSLDSFAYEFPNISEAFLASNSLCFAIGCVRWDATPEDELYSEKVKIIFECLYTTTNQIGKVASAKQNRDVTKHIIETVSFTFVVRLILNCMLTIIEVSIFICSGNV